MGKWAQQRKRGSIGHTAPALQPPPAPVLAVIISQLTSSTTISQTSVGSCYLHYSADNVAPFIIAQEAEWEQVHPWGDTGDLEPGYYKAQQSGDGISYAALFSPFSGTLHLS